MDQYITNINLSSQATGLTGSEILQIVDSTGGILVPAHAFTPHKSFYGKCVPTYKDIFSEEEWEKVPAFELGLSADTQLADHLTELKDKTFLSNSDAHSLPKIAREYNLIKMDTLTFSGFKKALIGSGESGVTGNYGLDPRLGKYHRSYCRDCDQSFAADKPILTCPECDNDNLVVGVKDRLLKIGDRLENQNHSKRPSYIHQVPLLDIPGIGAKTLEKLLKEFGTEMDIIHRTESQELKECVRDNVAEKIIKARSGNINIKSGGGGNYGKVMG